MKNRETNGGSAHRDRFLRAFESAQDRRHEKLADFTPCADGDAVVIDGRWRRQEAPAGAP